MSLALVQQTKILFNSAGISLDQQPALHKHIEFLMRDAKESVSYYCDVEQCQLPCWKLLRLLKAIRCLMFII